MELKWLKDFIALAEQGSFSKAADARFVTQPAFSRRIRSLENWLGVSLVDRNQHPTTLTPTGEAFAEQARLLVSQIYGVQQQMQALSDGRSELKILAQHALAVAFLPAWMNTLESLTDGALISIEAGNLHDNVETFLSGNSDFLLCYSSGDLFSELQREDVETLQVGVDKLVPVSGCDHSGQPLHHLDQQTPLKLLRHPPQSFFGRLLEQQCYNRLLGHVQFNIACENALSEALKALVLNGYGVAWLPQSLIRRELDQQLLVQLPEPLSSVDLQITLYRLRQSHNPGAQQFWDYLKELYNPGEPVMPKSN
ncbi:MAG: LysR substrate-binding domain-containing protein [Amphritea sp.]|nr:LysR substrate-binding domain-containing protein [Amphritea sp.]